MSATILLIEDTPSLQMLYQSILRNAGHEVVVAETVAAGQALFRRHAPRIVLLDLLLPDGDGLDLMRECVAQRPGTNVVVITSDGSINRAVEAMRAGAFDFLVKPFDEQRLLNAVRNAGADTAGAPTPGRDQLPRQISGFIGSSPQMQDVYAMVQSVGRSMAAIFITGESGTGKEICAQAVHDASARANGPFVPLNCGAIPSDLLESEVFGHLKGSFTGAISDKQGAAAVADGGTLFLDEICEMDLNLQTKLLRFLQTSTIQPVGSTRPRKVNVRIICATNRCPLEEVRAGRFREDLYYRLHVVPIQLPPLRERGEDVIDIAQAALVRFAGEEGKRFTGLSEEVKAMFRAAPWPGNVRQLLNVMRNVVVLHDGPVVTPAMLPDDMRGAAPRPARREVHADGGQDGAAGPGLEGLAGKTLAEIERLVIEAAIARHGGSVPRAARELDVSPSTLYRKREAWGTRASS